MGIAITQVNITVHSVRIMVINIRSPMISLIGMACTMDIPNSPRITLDIHFAYCQ